MRSVKSGGRSEAQLTFLFTDIEASTRAWERRPGLVAEGQITAAGRRLRDDIEDRTDAMEQPVVDAIGADFEATVECLETCSAACIEAGAFPPR